MITSLVEDRDRNDGRIRDHELTGLQISYFFQLEQVSFMQKRCKKQIVVMEYTVL
jgi:hypothetical protein